MNSANVNGGWQSSKTGDDLNRFLKKPADFPASTRLLSALNQACTPSSLAEPAPTP